MLCNLQSTAVAVVLANVGRRMFVHLGALSVFQVSRKLPSIVMEHLLSIPGGGGGLSDEVAVPAEAVFPLPDHIDLDIGGAYAKV